MELINQWLEVVSEARQRFTSEKYQEWRFIVGAQGTLEERIELGKRAIEILAPKNHIITRGILNFSSPLEGLKEGLESSIDGLIGQSDRVLREIIVTSAVSQSGDYPMQRGVKKE